MLHRCMRWSAVLEVQVSRRIGVCFLFFLER